MSASALQSNNQPAVRRLTEERYFAMPPHKALPLIKAAVAHATGVELVELADGMWEGRLELESGYREVTVRTQPTESGTNVEVSLEDHSSFAAIALWGTLLVVLAMFIIPIFFIIAYTQRKQREETKARLIQMHKTWREITDALGAPQRSSYRDAPRRIYAPAEEREAEQEAAELEAAEQEAQRRARV